MGEKCEKQNGALVASVISGTRCFSGMHIVMVSINSCAVFLLFATGLVYKLFVFSYAVDVNNPSARFNSRAEVAFHIVRTAMIVLAVMGRTVFSVR